MAIKVFNEKEPAPGKDFGKPELYAIAIGTVIGSGVITLIVPAIKMTGYSAWLAYLFAIFMGVCMILPYFFISSTLRMGGGAYSLLNGLGGPRLGGMYAFLCLTQCFGLSLFGTSAAAYLGDIFPILGSSGARVVMGVALLTFFYVVNLMGMNIMAKVQKLMVWLLIAALLLFTVVGIAKIKLPIFNFNDPNWLINGWGVTFNEKGLISGGFFGAVLLFIYSCNGYYALTGYGRNAKNPRHDIPLVLLACIPTLILVYVGSAIAAVGTLSLEEYGQSTTLVFAARSIFPPAVFIVFIIAGPIMALLSTLNTSFAVRGMDVSQSCADGWLPKWLGRKNKHGAPATALTFFYIIGVIPILFQMSIVALTNLVQLIVAFFMLLNFFGFIRMPKLYPNAWKRARFHVPNPVYYGCCCLSLFVSCITIWKTCLSLSPALAAGNIIVIAVLSLASYIRGKSGTDVSIRTSVWSGDEAEDERATAMNRATVEKLSATPKSAST